MSKTSPGFLEFLDDKNLVYYNSAHTNLFNFFEDNIIEEVAKNHCCTCEPIDKYKHLEGIMI